MLRYQNKRVVIIGGTSGIGLATAQYLLNKGAQVIVTGRSAADLQTAKPILGEHNVLKNDISLLSEMANLRKQIATRFAAIDLLFINAGITAMGEFTTTREEDYDRLFGINTKGAYFMIQTLAPLISDGGAIVVTTSVANVKGLPSTSVYAATKAALRSMVRSFARELLPRQIRVNAVSPGPIDTPILGKTLGEDAAEKARAQFEENNPMKRFGQSEEVARAVAFLAFGATYTTGAELPVDGGASQL